GRRVRRLLGLGATTSLFGAASGNHPQTPRPPRPAPPLAPGPSRLRGQGCRRFCQWRHQCPARGLRSSLRRQSAGAGLCRCFAGVARARSARPNGRGRAPPLRRRRRAPLRSRREERVGFAGAATGAGASARSFESEAMSSNRSFAQLLLLSLYLPLPAVAASAPAEDLFKQGSQAYIAGGFEQSALLFREAAASAPASGLLHNLGNAEWQ